MASSGIVLERLDDAELLAHAARVRPHRSTQGGLAQLEAVGQVGPQRGRSPGEGGQLVEQPLPGEAVPERDPAGQIADAPTDLHRIALDVATQDRGTPRGRVEESEQQSDGGRLAGAVGAEEAEDLALVDRDVEIDEGRSATTARPRRRRSRAGRRSPC